MPELPEVEIMTRTLRRKLRGQTIRHVEVCDSKLRVQLDLTGAKIQNVRRRAKFIIFDLKDDRYLLVHLRMTGWFEFSEPKRYRFALHTDQASAYFEDARRFGVVETLSGKALAERLSELGPEPLSGDVDWTALRKTGRAIKVALLDQRLVAGVGNIYASESLWLAKINPWRAANKLTAEEVWRIHAGIVQSMKQAIGYGARIFDVQKFAVYDREGQPCRRCGAVILRKTQAQRSTFYCPDCQMGKTRKPSA